MQFNVNEPKDVPIPLKKWIQALILSDSPPRTRHDSRRKQNDSVAGEKIMGEHFVVDASAMDSAAPTRELWLAS